jgi:peptide/nickel transport system substrate-binding protein
MSNSYWDRILESRISRRRALAGASAAAILVACGGDSGGGGFKFEDAATSRQPGKVWNSGNDWKLADETKAAVKGGIYRGVLDEDQAGSFDALIQAPSQVLFSGHVHEYLMGRNRGPGVDPSSVESNNPVPVLAESWEFSPDGMTATFTLRQNVKFHNVAPVNGRVMDMDDWKSSAERFMALSPQRVPITDTVDHFEYPDARHMVWKMKFPYAPLGSRIWSERYGFQIVPKELNADQNLASRLAIGTNFKVLDKHQPAITMEYKKHAEYWGGEPFIDRWHAPIIPEYANRYAQFVRGNIQSFTPSAREVLQLARDVPGAVIVAVPPPDDHISRIRFGRQNHKTLPWKDVRVRIAIRRATDFKGIGEFVSNKQQFEAGGIPVEVISRTHVTRGASYFLDPEKGELGALSANYLFDAAEAKKLTAAAGFTNAIDIDYYVLPAGGGQIPEEDQLTIDRLQASGVFKVNVIRSQNTVVHRQCRSLGQCDGLVQSSTSEDVDHVIFRDYHSEGNTEGEQAYPDPRVDKVAEAQRKEMDPVKRIEYLKEFQKLAAETMPAIPYVHQYTTFSFRWPWLHNINYGMPEIEGVADGRPIWGGHLQWLDKDMPNREKGAS